MEEKRCVNFLIACFHMVQSFAEISLLVVEEVVKSHLISIDYIGEISYVPIALYLFQMFGLHNFMVHLLGVYLTRRISQAPYNFYLSLLLRCWVFLAIEVCIIHVAKYVISIQLAVMLENKLDETLSQGIELYYSDLHWNIVWNDIQYFYSCCGLRGYKDWRNATYTSSAQKHFVLSLLELNRTLVPSSCCIRTAECEIAMLEKYANSSLLEINELNVSKINTNGCWRNITGTTTSLLEWISIINIFCVSIQNLQKVVATMSFEYIQIQEPVYLANHKQNAEDDYLLVKKKDMGNVPIECWDSSAYCFTTRFKKFEDDLVNCEVRPDDVWVASYPKSGTTWCQEMVWLICNELNFDLAKSESLSTRFPFVDVSLVHDLPNGASSFDVVRNMVSPRFIKTHLPVSMLPNQYWSVLPKTIYISRNVKSVAVSYFHHSKNIFYLGTKEDFIRSFMKDLQFYSPVHNHVIGYRSLFRCKNVLFLQYEEMKYDLKSVIGKVCSFFERNYSDDQIELLCQHLSFKAMKANVVCNYGANNEDLNDPDKSFIRRGEVDSWKYELDLDLITELDNWTRDSVNKKDLLPLFLSNK